jgi:adenylate cyclase
MGIEIERKFLLLNNDWQNDVSNKVKIVQGYLANTELSSIRIRLQGEIANLNIKSMQLGVCRSEFEYPVPVIEAENMLNKLCLRPLIDKTRYYIKHAAHIWEIDVFEAENFGLVVAEIELSTINEKFEHPPWLGKEVSDDERYYNVSLIKHPFKNW